MQFISLSYLSFSSVFNSTDSLVLASVKLWFVPYFSCFSDFFSLFWYSSSRETAECILTIPILQTRLENWLNPSALVSKSASWQCVLTWINLMTFSSILSLTTWQSISICLVLSWNTRFEPICRATWLSQNHKTSKLCSIPISLRKYNIQTISQVATAIALYSTSA